MNRLSSVCVFCGAAAGTKGAYREAAEDLGRHLARNSIRLVYGGGNVGLMGALADACLGAGGEVWGIIPRTLMDREQAHPRLQRLLTVENLHERKRLMNEHADGFLVLPGGLGTLEELFEVVSWTQLGVIAKPTCLINPEGYWDRLLAALDFQSAEGFISPASRGLLPSAETSREAVDVLAEWDDSVSDRWTP